MQSAARVYLSGPIHGCSDAECVDWRNQVKKYFPNAIDPLRHDFRGRELENLSRIVELDKQDIINSQAVLASCPHPSYGTAMEILYAWQAHIPVVAVVNNYDAYSQTSPWLIYHTKGIFTSYERAVIWIAENVKVARID